MKTSALSSAFVWRRIQSLFGLWIVLFLCEHLLVNSQAALLIGDQGSGFVSMVNSIHNLPYLQVIELTLLGVPILVHMLWGVKYLWTAKFNSSRSNGSTPALPEYSRNHAYTWQRITSWILLFLLIFHVVKFRFLEYPTSINFGEKQVYFVRLQMDPGLYSVADRLDVSLYDQEEITQQKAAIEKKKPEEALIKAAERIRKGDSTEYNARDAVIVQSAQNYEQKLEWLAKLSARPLRNGEVMATASDFGTATLLTVRDTFKSPIYVGIYTIFVLAACFHAFNGFWTFLITWGIIIKMATQRWMVKLVVGLMILVAFLGLMAVWGTYWLNLKY